jgi:hypothetical protein
MDAWVKVKLAKVVNDMPTTNSFSSYLEFEWLQKIECGWLAVVTYFMQGRSILMQPLKTTMRI